MINVPRWYCRGFGDVGFVFVGVDLVLPDGAMIGLREAVHPPTLDEAELFRIVEKMTWMLDRAAQPLPASRAGAFGGD